MKTQLLALPREWKRHVRSAMIQVASLAHWSLIAESLRDLAKTTAVGAVVNFEKTA